MQYETVWYTPNEPPFLVDEIKKTLPAKVVDELIPSKIYVTIEANNKEAISFLDEFFEIGKARRFVKRKSLEVDKKEIDNYDYFLISPRGVELGRAISAEIIRPTCDYEPCPVGSQIKLPVRITRNRANKLGIATIGRAWGHTNEFLMSAKLKGLFDANSISGLEYTRCVMHGDHKEGAESLEAPFYAKIIQYATDHANAIFLNESCYCNRHSVIFSSRLDGCYVSRSEFGGKDFISVEGVIVENKHYHYRSRSLIVSRRVLRILLKDRIAGLMKMGSKFGERFLPIMPCESDISIWNYN